MTREDRIARARRMAAEHAPPPQVKLQQQVNRVVQRLANVGTSQAQRHVAALERSGSAAYLSPGENPQLWERAVDLARLVAIARAKRRDTITSAEVRWAIQDELRVLVGEADISELAMAVTRDADGVALAVIIVDPDTGEPSDDVLLDAMERGFDAEPATLQRRVFEHFG